MEDVTAVRRLFLAASLSDEARHALAALLSGGEGSLPIPGRAVPPENWHVTLKFLGGVDQHRFELLQLALSEEDLGPAFDLTVEGLGAFPRPVRARVVWVGVGTGAEAVGALAGAVERAAERAGFTPEERPFHAHVTVSRLRPHQDVTAFIDRTTIPAIRFRVDDVVLYQSRLGRGGAQYEELERFPLSGSG